MFFVLRAVWAAVGAMIRFGQESDRFSMKVMP